MNTKIVIPAAALLLYVAYRKYTLATRATINFKTIEVESWSPLTVVAIFSIYNPTDVSAEMNNIAGDIYLNGVRVASVDSVQSMTIAKQTRSEIGLRMQPSAAGFISAVTEFIKGAKGLRLQFSGSVIFDGIQIPMTQMIYS